MSLLDVIVEKFQKREEKKELMEKVPELIEKSIDLRNSNPSEGKVIYEEAWSLYDRLLGEFKIVHKNYKYWKKTDRDMSLLFKIYCF